MKLNSVASIFYFIFYVNGNLYNNQEKNKVNQHLRIVDGTPVDIIHVPYQVSLETDKKHNCGGSLISEYHILTAAHCIAHITPYSNGNWISDYQLQVRAGTSRAGEGGTLMSVEWVKTPGKRINVFDKDIGIVKLKDPIKQSSTIRPIALSRNLALPDYSGFITGYGSQNTTNSMYKKHTLMIAEVTIYGKSECEKKMEMQQLASGLICAGRRNGFGSSCFGDSGGPLIMNGALTGVISGGSGCGRLGRPGLYTEVLSYISWIESCLKSPDC